MEFRGFVGVSFTFIALLFLAQLINARVLPEYDLDARIGTTKCLHTKLTNKAIDASKCVDGNLNEYVEKIFSNYKEYLEGTNKTVDLVKGCQIHNEFFRKTKDCFMDFVSTCLPDHVPTWFSRVYDAVEINCNCPLNRNSQCHIIKDVDGLSRAMNDLFTHAQTVQLDLGAYFLSHVIFDKPCDMGLRIGKTGEVNGQCVISKFQPLGMPIYNYIVQNTGNLDAISPCTSSREAFDNCFGENLCVSEREMHLIRDLMVTGYRRGMETLIRIADEFGSLENFVSSHQDSVFKWHDHEIHFIGDDLAQINMSEPMVQRGFEFASHVLKDFETRGCRANQEVFARMDLRNREQSDITQSPITRPTIGQNMTYTKRMSTMSYMTRTSTLSVSMAHQANESSTVRNVETTEDFEITSSSGQVNDNYSTVLIEEATEEVKTTSAASCLDNHSFIVLVMFFAFKDLP